MHRTAKFEAIYRIFKVKGFDSLEPLIKILDRPSIPIELFSRSTVNRIEVGGLSKFLLIHVICVASSVPQTGYSFLPKICL